MDENYSNGHVPLRFKELSAKIRANYQVATYDQMEEATEAVSLRDMEKRFLELIALGNDVLADDLFNWIQDNPLSISTDQLSESPLQNARYSIVASVTLFCRTAIDNGLPEHLAFRISDFYIRHLDKTEDIQEINFLFVSVFKEYCQVMQDWRLHTYRQEIKDCCKYILMHIHHKISLGDLSRISHLSPNHISDLFLRETGYRPTDYIRAQKLNYARHILDYYDVPMALISSLLAFPSPSAFAQQFKQQYRVTPTQYLKRKR